MPQIKIGEIEELPDGSARVSVEYDDNTKEMLMNAWGLTEWDEARAQVEFIKAFRAQIERENKDAI